MSNILSLNLTWSKQQSNMYTEILHVNMLYRVVVLPPHLDWTNKYIHNRLCVNFINLVLIFLPLTPQPQQQSSESSQTTLAPIPSPPPQRAPILSPRLASVHSQPLYFALFLPTEPSPSPSGHVCNPSHTASTTDLTDQQFSGAWSPSRHPLSR